MEHEHLAGAHHQHHDHQHGGHEHHHSHHQEHRKAVLIIVEGTPHEWGKEFITYAEVVTLEVPDFAQHPEITYTVCYKHGPVEKPEGVLAPGASVRVHNEMRFYVSETGQS